MLNKSSLSLREHDKLCLRKFFRLTQHLQLRFQLVEVARQLQLILHILFTIDYFSIELIDRYIQGQRRCLINCI